MPSLACLPPGDKMKKNILIILSAIVILFFAMGSATYEHTLGKKSNIILANKTFTSARIYLPATGTKDKSYLIPLDVKLQRGSGKILVNIDNPSFIIDTQASIRSAVKAAQKITHTNLNDTDITFSIDVGHALISGPSAGAGMAVALVSIIEQKHIKNNIVITGQVDSFGNIKPVGAIAEKIRAAEKAGFKTFILPKGESTYEVPIQTCNESAKDNYVERRCNIKYQKKNIAQETNLNINEVSTLQEAADIILT